MPFCVDSLHGVVKSSLYFFQMFHRRQNFQSSSEVDHGSISVSKIRTRWVV